MGEVWCWGDNSQGQLGDGTQDDRRLPVPVVGMADVVAVAAGQEQSCAVKADGSAWCWGGSLWGGLGNGSIGWNVEEPVPLQVERLADVRSIFAGSDSTCAIVGESLRVACWGQNNRGQLGVDSFDNQTTPAWVGPYTGPVLAPIVSVDVGWSHGCFVLASGEARCAGAAERLGSTMDMVDQPVPIPVEGRADFLEVAVGNRRSCGRTRGGQVVCWDTDPAADPIAGLEGVVKLAAGARHFCALKADGTVWCWGRGGSGQLGHGSTSDSDVPVQAMGLDSVVDFDAGGARTCARRVDDTIWCWGDNRQGAIGDGTLVDKLVPTQVVFR